MTARFQEIGIVLLAGLAVALLVIGLGVAQALPVPGSASNFEQRVMLIGQADEDMPLVANAANKSAPLVVIDPGHGGFDPGAVAANGRAEKDVVLGLARSLRARLLELGGVRVALTRDDDRFLQLEERTSIARRLEADLFISIHADSGGEEHNAAGASLYTLSQSASDAHAARFAARENSADVVNGVRLGSNAEVPDVVNTILFQLSQRRAQEQAVNFARLVVREGAGELRFRDPARRTAALVVLGAPDVPSVLFEAGFMTNPAEAERLASADGQAQFARITASAIRSFFAQTKS